MEVFTMLKGEVAAELDNMLDTRAGLVGEAQLPLYIKHAYREAGSRA